MEQEKNNEVIQLFHLIKNCYKEEDYPNILEYISEMSELDRQACIIAHSHLETSFNILRTNGYKKWIISKNT
jgi:hypothetical protein